ncbi:hypothetical protein FOH24_13295 [Acetobacter tropicalis]|nr:hypothetical protein [Acetobacter tropicalis]KAA8386449.1 hypothetical protein FOH22_11365 [Acetobacter tropicalis]KAA8387512.1 hypothetical protein FOH24_13295 [Acetobacter tropicalis]MBC9007786.1 hypothetical protein [Acetobacter tropicalis]MDO8171770.1 hypothetical protein [Acetobacter tropicalis]
MTPFPVMSSSLTVSSHFKTAVMNGVIRCGSNGGECLGRKNGRLFPFSVPFLSLFRPFEGSLKARYLNFICMLRKHMKSLRFFFFSLVLSHLKMLSLNPLFWNVFLKNII